MSTKTPPQIVHVCHYLVSCGEWTSPQWKHGFNANVYSWDKTFCFFFVIWLFKWSMSPLQSDLRPIGKKLLPSDINSGRVDKAGFPFLLVNIFYLCRTYSYFLAFDAKWVVWLRKKTLFCFIRLIFSPSFSNICLFFSLFCLVKKQNKTVHCIHSLSLERRCCLYS